MEVLAVAGPAFSFRREFDALSAALPRRVPLIHEAGGHMGRSEQWPQRMIIERVVMPWIERALAPAPPK